MVSSLPDSFARALHLCVSLLLIAAAVLKGYQVLRTTPDMSLEARLFELALIEFELILGGMLLLGRYPKLTWAAVVTVFTIFAGVSVKKALAHVPACGCFGPASVNPRVMAGIDLAIVVGFLITGPRLTAPTLRGAGYRAVSVTLAALMVLAAAASATTAMPRRGLAVESRGVYDFGTIDAEDAGRLEHRFAIQNTAARPIHVTGAVTSCACTVADLPKDPIVAGGTATVLVRADWSHAAGSTYSKVTLHTDSFWTPEVNLIINAQVTPADEKRPATGPTTSPSTR